MSDELFPPDACAEVMGELASWTSVQDLLVAARILEGRALAEDQVTDGLVMPLHHPEPQFAQIFIIFLRHLSAGYRVPIHKIAVARSLDPRMSDATAEQLGALRFVPTVRMLHERGNPANRRLGIQAEPATIEVIRAPLNCLMGLYLDKYEFTQSVRNTKLELAAATGGAGPTVFHRPYADARLPGFIEAACFYALKLDVGTRFGSPGVGTISYGYRSVNLQTLPPADPRMLGLAFQAAQTMLDGLR